MLFPNSQETALIEWLESRSFSEVADLVNEYLGGDDYIYDSLKDVADVAPSDDPLWVARALFFGNVESWSDSVRFNGYGNLESVWLVDQLPLDSLADAMIEAGDQSFEAVAMNADGVELAVAYLADDDDQAVEMIADELDGLEQVASIYWRLA